MKKSMIIIAVIIAIIVVGIGIAFSNMDNNINVDIQKLAEELINAQIFEDDLSPIERDSVIKKYNFSDKNIKNINSYVGTGATSEEILIIELLNKEDINTMKKIIETKIEERKIDFENYLPKEVYKLENYNLEIRGNYIILCISSDYDKAKEIIDIYINK